MSYSMPAYGSYRQIFSDTLEYYRNDCVNEFKKYDAPTLKEHYISPQKKVTEITGETNLRRFEDILENGFKWKRHRFQREFHEEITKALAESIVGEKDWEQVGARLIKQRGWTKIAKMVLGKAPRRFGKSVSIGYVVVGYAEVFYHSFFLFCIFYYHG